MKKYTAFIILIIFFIFGGCSIRKMAVNSVANALTSEGTSVFATDNDPELVAEALPFALKTMEALLQSVPDNRELLIGTSSGFVQYSHAFVLQPADLMEKYDLEGARQQRKRAKKLFLRARDYGLAALDLEYEEFLKQVSQNSEETLAVTRKEDVPALYWTGVAWLSAISISTDDMELVADLPIAIKMLERCLHLNESWQKGAIHEVFIRIDAGRSVAEGGGFERAIAHYERLMQLIKDHSVSPNVTYAQSICIKQQDRKKFEELLNKVLAFDVEKYPEFKLSNILSQQKARYLLQNIDDYFI